MTQRDIRLQIKRILIVTIVFSFVCLYSATFMMSITANDANPGLEPSVTVSHENTPEETPETILGETPGATPEATPEVSDPEGTDSKDSSQEVSEEDAR